MKIILGTTNKGKIKEMEIALKDLDIPVLNLKDLNCNYDVEEDANTFYENAFKKSCIFASLYEENIVISDDSGLEIPALNNEPGIYSARYASDHDDEANITKVLQKMEGKEGEERKAVMKTIIVISIKNGDNTISLTTKSKVEGYITKERRGTGGFGYDKIFYIPKLNKTLAEVTNEERLPYVPRTKALKNALSHLHKMIKLLKE